MAIINTVEKQPDLQVEEDTKKKSKPAKAVKKKEEVKTSNDNKSVAELKVELQKLILEIRISKESNTSLVKKLRKEIARKLTIESQNRNK